MPSPAPCPTPAGCPTPQPCSEVFDAQCVVYTGDALDCNGNVIIGPNNTLAEAYNNIINYFCESLFIESDIICGQDTVVTANTSVTNAIADVVDYVCTHVPPANCCPTFYADINQIGELGLSVTLTNGTAPFTYSWTIEQLTTYYAGLSFSGATNTATVYVQKVTDAYFAAPGLLKNIYSALVKVKVTDANGQIASAYYNAQAFDQVG